MAKELYKGSGLIGLTGYMEGLKSFCPMELCLTPLFFLLQYLDFSSLALKSLDIYYWSIVANMPNFAQPCPTQCFIPQPERLM